MIRSCMFFFLIAAGFLFAQEEKVVIRYLYSDGNNNRYWIQGDTIRYIPVKSEYSSSGLYDGGEPFFCVVDPEELTPLIQLLEQALANTSFHIKERWKGSPTIMRAYAPAKEVILHPYAKEKTLIETLLMRLTGRDP